MKKHEIPTPALVVDLDKLRRNIDEMAEEYWRCTACRKRGERLACVPTS